MNKTIEILHGVTAIILTYHPHHAKLQVLPNMIHVNSVNHQNNNTLEIQFNSIFVVKNIYMCKFEKQYNIKQGHYFTNITTQTNSKFCGIAQ